MTQFSAVEAKTLRLKRAEQALRMHLEPSLLVEEITFEHWQVLASLLAEPGQRMTELAESAVLPAATLTRHVDKLVERALIVRRIDSNDKRRIVVALSSRGEQLANRLRDAEQAAQIEVDLGSLVADAVR